MDQRLYYRGTVYYSEHPADLRDLRDPVFPLELESSREQARPAEDRFDDALLRVLCAHEGPAMVARVP